jgi:hypothetical protein
MKSTVIIILSYIIVYNNIYIVALSPVRFLYTRTGISPKDTIIIILYIITKKKHRVKKKNCVGMEYNIRYIYSYYTRRFTEVYVRRVVGREILFLGAFFRDCGRNTTRMSYNDQDTMVCRRSYRVLYYFKHYNNIQKPT